MSKKPTVYPKAGRPRLPAPKVKKTVSLLPQVYQYLMLVGDGVLSHGVETAAKHHEKFSKPTTPTSKGSS